MGYNVYDFDRTIYQGDSTLDFYFFCLKIHPKIIIEIPIALLYLSLYILRIKTKTEYKEKCFRFLRHLNSIDELLEEFWVKNNHKISDFYRGNCSKNDVIVSASPEFLLEPICKQLKIRHLIGSKVDKHSGIYEGENCKGKEKLSRYIKELPESVIKVFYSDSLTDQPLASMAVESYIVRKNKVISWSEYRPSLFEKFATIYFNREFLIFVFCGGLAMLANIISSIIISIKVNSTISFVLGYSIGLITVYMLNASLVYKAKYKIDSFLKCVLSYIPSFLILFTFVFVFLNVLHFNRIVVYTAAGLLSLPISYKLVKTYAFAKKNIVETK